MERIIKRGQPGSADDGAFFKHNPGRSYRVRLATTDEVEIAKLGCDEALPREQFWYVAMHQIKPGVRRRCFLGGSLKDWSTIEDPARAAGTSSRIFGAASPTTGPSGSRRASTSASRATVSRTCCAKSSPTRGGAPTVESKILQVLLECKIDDDRRRHLSGSARGVTGTMMMGAASSGIALARKQMVSPTLPRSRWRQRRDRQLSTCRNRAHSCSRTCLVFSQGKSRRRTRNRDHRPGQARAGVASLSPLIPAPLRIPLAEFQER
jgi:hypothetical protein